MTPKFGASLEQMLEFQKRAQKAYEDQLAVDAQRSPGKNLGKQVAPLVKTPKSLSRGPQMSPEMRARLTGPGGPYGPHMAAPKQQRPLGGGPGVKLMPNMPVPSPLPLGGVASGEPRPNMPVPRLMAGLGAAMKPPMMKSGGEVKREVESLASRYPKKGIDPTIPAGVREKLVEQEREKMFKAGEKAHSERTLAKGGSAKAYAKSGVTRADGCAQRGKTKGRMV